MTLLGLDLNGTRARAVLGPEGAAKPLGLTEGEDELAMAISLAGRRPEVGGAALALCRQSPHLVCLDYLAHLETPRTWSAGRNRIDAAKAMGLVLEQIRPACAGAQSLVLSLPPYLSPAQAARISTLVKKARLPFAGSVTAPLAIAMGARPGGPPTGLVAVMDADDHALSWAVVKVGADQVQVLDGESLPRLSLRAWKSRLIDAIAETCVRHSRRDLRDSAAAEQMLYDQLDDVLESTRREELVEVVVRASQWCQNLQLQPEQVRGFCRRLAEETIAEVSAGFTALPVGPPPAILVTAAVARLPGLTAALKTDTPPPTAVLPLSADAAARGAHLLAGRISRREVPAGHLDTLVPLPKSGPASRRAVSLTPDY